jgi:hypothetical protein
MIRPSLASMFRLAEHWGVNDKGRAPVALRSAGNGLW